MFLTKNVCVDLGYLGIGKDYQLGSLEIPYKKSRKSKKNPNPSLSAEQKLHNKVVSQKRVCVENSIAGMKRYHILSVKYRGKSIKRFDSSIEICAGLWNFKVDRRLKNRRLTI
jgi:DDE superfamily endonuclease